MKPFWNYYGGKWRAAPLYPAPMYDTIVEPFAGAAGYSLRHHQRKVVLIEKYAVVAEMWRYLIGVSAAEVMRIPCVDHVDDLPSWVPQGGRWLVGFAMSAAVAEPRMSLSAGLRKLRTMGRTMGGWGEPRRARVAAQVEHIRHWRVIEGDYTEAPDVPATWFIDPPYRVAGKHYRHHAKDIDTVVLAEWCRARSGQVMVCENEGATWLPFRPFATTKKSNMSKTGSYSREAIWTA